MSVVVSPRPWTRPLVMIMQTLEILNATAQIWTPHIDRYSVFKIIQKRLHCPQSRENCPYSRNNNRIDQVTNKLRVVPSAIALRKQKHDSLSRCAASPSVSSLLSDCRIFHEL
ncbi:uncharacterized protein EDB93DRAFT_1131451 [Suillus bovinus]|uniref:uncharacterized protein n=1 Tax=Suillus bovinus TaxID=48563 RepID=UPI001B85FA96|nr:uncharacterized protein EDB93DRAFT_1131451 [Suillus bovinus]KAG2155141.1 hypothetical protein EDB93DRAFT_1131451 [Suillus bovinus]